MVAMKSVRGKMHRWLIRSEGGCRLLPCVSARIRTERFIHTVCGWGESITIDGEFCACCCWEACSNISLGLSRCEVTRGDSIGARGTTSVGAGAATGGKYGSGVVSFILLSGRERIQGVSEIGGRERLGHGYGRLMGKLGSVGNIFGTTS